MLSRPFLVLFGAFLVASMGISMVSPILPVYAEDLGASGIWIGLTFSIYAVTHMLMSPFAGRWSDRYGRKRFVILGLLCYVVAALGYLTADSFIQLLAFRAFSGIGTSLIYAVGYAYLGDIVPRGREGRWLGVFSVAEVLGYGSGPILSGILRDLFGFDSVFVGMTALMGSSALLVYVLLPEHAASARQSAGQPSTAVAGMIEALRHRAVLAVVLFMGLASLAFGSVSAFLAIFLDEMGVSATAIGVVFAIQFAAAGVGQPLLGGLADRMDRRTLLVGGLVGCSLSLVALGLADSYAVVFVLLIVLGVAQAAAWAAAGAIQVVAGRKAGMGTVMGLGSTGDGIGTLVGGVLGGLFAGWFGTAAAFYSGAGALAAGTLVLAWLLWSLPRSEVNDEAVEERAAGTRVTGAD